jgi:copper homeostasis protein (lipoprotein)
MNKLSILLLLLMLYSCSSIEETKNSALIKGMYSYMADAGIFVDCKTQKKHHVAMESDNISLEKAYLNIAEEPGEKILVTLNGNIEKRPKIEGEGERTFLIVSRFDKIWPNIDCSRNLGTATLKNTFWALRYLDGKSISDYKVEKDINFLMQLDNSIKGFSGCNNFFANYTVFNDTLKFTKVGTTRKLCDGNMEIEQKLLGIFENIITYKIFGEYLYLYNRNELVAKFESVYFN